jgi:GTP pyrophosphokinase
MEAEEDVSGIGFASELRSVNRKLDSELLGRASEFAAAAPRGRIRLPSSPRADHAHEVARILAGLQLDTVTVAAGLLHDVLEESELTRKDLEKAFSPEIAALVEGVTRVGGLGLSSDARPEPKDTLLEAENHRRLFLSMARDLRVVLIKLADRLVEMRALESLPPARMQEVARETRDVLAPLAHRLGMARIGWELDDLALRFLEPEVHADLARRVGESRKSQEGYLRMVEVALGRLLHDSGIEARLSWRPKHLYSIHQKMKDQSLPFEAIDDLLALRVIARDVADCYHALGVIHTSWPPVAGRFTDYVATPRSNMYQSLHTTVVGPLARKLEIQIRTAAMHRTAEEGIAAHWQYKEKTKGKDRDILIGKFAWLKQAFEWLQDTRDPREFLDLLRIDLFPDEVFVFTPGGDVKRLPLGATVLDFAFAVHSEVGLHASGARVNRRIGHLADVLANGDIVEIKTSPAKRPSRDWLGIVKSSRAKSKLRAYFQDREDQERLERGRKMLQKELRKRRLLKQYRERGGLPEEEWIRDLLRQLASGDLNSRDAVRRLFPGQDVPRQASVLTVAPSRAGIVAVGAGEAGDYLLDLARCCRPIPGDDIAGFITRGRGVSVHRRGCPNLPRLTAQVGRIIPLAWEGARSGTYAATIEVVGESRPGLLSEISSAISERGANISGCRTTETRGRGRGRFQVEVQDTNHLARIMEAVLELRGVLGVRRVSSGAR